MPTGNERRPDNIFRGNYTAGSAGRERAGVGVRLAENVERIRLKGLRMSQASLKNYDREHESIQAKTTHCRHLSAADIPSIATFSTRVLLLAILSFSQSPM